MCETSHENNTPGVRKLPAAEAIGTVLAHDITEIRPGEFKGRAFKKGHIIKEEDVCHLQRLGKENLFVLDIAEDEMHEDEAAYALAGALRGSGVEIKGEPKEGKISLVAEYDGILSIHKDALMDFNLLGEVMCATLHDHTLVKKGQTVASTRAIPLIVKRGVVAEAVKIGEKASSTPPAPGTGAQRGGIVQVLELRRPKAGVVITGNEVYYGRIKDAFAPVITRKIEAIGGEIVGMYYAPDDEAVIEARLQELIAAGADLLITTGGMSVDPDDVTRFAIRNVGATGVTYGSAVLPGAMFLVGYLERDPGPRIPILGIPACGMYAKTTIFDLVLPRVLAGETVGRRELAELGHGGLCLKCETCHYPVCPFGK